MIAHGRRRRHSPLRIVAIMLASLLLLGGVGVATFINSPWPSAMLIRTMFDRESARTAEELRAYTPAADRIEERLDIAYREGDADATLDVFRPASAGQRALPTVVWVHGGAWIAGDKSQLSNYLRIIADRGYTVVGINYSIAPQSVYPTPVLQGMAALGYLSEHSAELGVDPSQLVLAGDSAGAQIAAQLAAIATSPSYAQRVGIPAEIRPEQLSATLLACGAYDVTLADVEGPFARFLRTVLWSYTGTRDYATDPETQAASVLNFVTVEFPATFLTVGNADALAPQSQALAERLGDLGVPLDALFFPEATEPGLEHQFQFNLELAGAREALERMIAFLDTHTST